ncbi:hypothetical protein [Rhizobium sp. NRK18]|uniref:hypothetical protein n=1 Tax=Rhizobium sp. NRK18 TaxID=2964667 RepID=UPI0021C38555|nr:hypothetical protein [Rhizobium sp. NRK18]MCQ2005882.1 hypothetical protein [Rhizobium sp. NRK18]
MLPPVRVEASSAVSAKAQGTVTPKASVVPAAAVRPELAKAVTHVANVEPGQLNVLSFGSSDPFPAALRTIATQLGDVLGMTRGDAESDSAFAQRLAAAIRNLPAASRAAVEKMISQALKTVQLQTLLEVLDSPAGVQAARIAALLEGGRARDGEAVTRNVLESYHQNEGEDADAVAEPLRQTPQSRGEAPAAGSPARPAATQQQQAVRVEQQVSAPAAALAGGEDDAPSVPTNIRQAAVQHSAIGEPPSVKSEAADVQALRQRLERAYGPDGQPSVEPEQAEPRQPPVANQNAARNASSERHQTLQILKGWTEVVNDRLIANAIRDPEQVAKAAELVKALSQAELPKAAVSAAARPAGPLPPHAAGTAAPEAGQALAPAEDDTALMRELARPATAEATRHPASEPQAQTRDPATANSSTTRQALLPEGAQTLAAQAMVAQSKDGIPFAQVGYLTAQDDLPEEKKRRRYAQPDGEAEGQAGDEQATGEQHEDADDGQNGERRTPRMISDEDGQKAADDVDDPMYDLYQRMAGLN